MKKRNLLIILLEILFLIALFAIISCEKSTNPTQEIEFNFTISNGAEWDEAISKIRTQGDGFSYTLSILNSFEMQNDESPTFGNCTDTTIELIGHDTPTISGNNWFLINPHQNLKIKDIILDNIFIRIETDAECTLFGDTSLINNEVIPIYVSAKAKLFMKDDSSVKKASYHLQSAIHCYGEFYMEGNASVSDNYFTGVWVYEPGVFYMKDNSTVSNNSIGGVSIGSFCTFYIQGNASVSNNGESGVALADSTYFYMQDNASVNNNGGFGVYMAGYNHIDMQGNSSINNNSLGGVDAAPWGQQNNFFMRDTATIHDNLGPAVRIGQYGNISMQDNAKVRNNKGWGVTINASGNFTMQDNALIDNNNGGVLIGNNTLFEMHGGKISNNYVTPDRLIFGSAVDIRGGKFIFIDGEISGNISEDNMVSSGTIYIGSTGRFEMKGGSIHGNINNILYESSAVYVFGGSFIMSGGVVYGSEASGAPANLANISGSGMAALIDIFGTNPKYGDGSDILPHIEDDLWGTDYTIYGHE